MSRRRVLALDVVLVLPLALLLQLSCYAHKNAQTPKDESCTVSGVVIEKCPAASVIAPTFRLGSSTLF
jgi:hypothetical protein